MTENNNICPSLPDGRRQYNNHYHYISDDFTPPERQHLSGIEKEKHLNATVRTVEKEQTIKLRAPDTEIRGTEQAAIREFSSLLTRKMLIWGEMHKKILLGLINCRVLFFSITAERPSTLAAFYIYIGNKLCVIRSSDKVRRYGIVL